MPLPRPPGRPTLRSLSEATNYDQPQVRILLGVLFCGGGNQLLLRPQREADRGQRGEAAGVAWEGLARRALCAQSKRPPLCVWQAGVYSAELCAWVCAKRRGLR